MENHGVQMPGHPAWSSKEHLSNTTTPKVPDSL